MMEKLTKTQLITLGLLVLLLLSLPVGLFLSQKNQESRSRAQTPMPPPIGSIFTLEGPIQVKTGEKFSVDIVLDTYGDPNFTISSADAFVSVSPYGQSQQDTFMLSVYRNGQVSLVNVSPGKIFDKYLYPPLSYTVRKWNQTTGLKQNGRNVGSDPVVSTASKACYDVINVGYTFPKPTSSQDECLHLMIDLENAVSLSVSPGGISLNWGGLNEKWFQDKDKTWYYIYTESSDLSCGGFAGFKCPDGFYCLYNPMYGKDVNYPDRLGTCIPDDLLIGRIDVEGGASSGSSSASIIGDSSTMNTVCTHDAKQCSDGSYVGRTGPNCEFAACPGSPIGVTAIPNPPEYGGNQIKISGTKTFAVDDKGYFKGFTGKEVFATLNFVAQYPGKVEIKLIPGSSIKGYLISQPASSGEPKERLFSNAPNLSLEVVSDQTCTPLNIDCGGKSLDDCTATMGAPPNGRWCPLTPTPHPGCYRKKEGDANCDGAIDGLDYSVWLNSQCSPGPNQKCAKIDADFNGDGKIDDSDYKTWFNNRGTK